MFVKWKIGWIYSRPEPENFHLKYTLHYVSSFRFLFCASSVIEIICGKARSTDGTWEQMSVTGMSVIWWRHKITSQILWAEKERLDSQFSFSCIISMEFSKSNVRRPSRRDWKGPNKSRATTVYCAGRQDNRYYPLRGDLQQMTRC